MIKTSSKTTVKGITIRKLQKKIRDAAAGTELTVGFLASGPSYPKGGPKVSEVAFWNEFGTTRTIQTDDGEQKVVHVPERSFIRSTFAENRNNIRRWRAEVFKKVLTKDWPIEKAMEALGKRIKFLIQAKIRSNIPPPNAPSTIARKARLGLPQVTLQETKLMVDSVDYEVKKGNE